MTMLETSANVQDQIFEAIKVGQDAVLSAVESLAETAAPITDRLPTAPFADQLPNGVDVIDNAFGFAQRLLDNQKDFATKLVQLYSPAKPAAKPAAKSTPKPAAKAV